MLVAGSSWAGVYCIAPVVLVPGFAEARQEYLEGGLLLTEQPVGLAVMSLLENAWGHTGWQFAAVELN